MAQRAAAGRGGCLLSRAVEALRGWWAAEVCVGADANGNRYFQWREKALSGELVERRRVRVPGDDLLYDPRTVPAEWRAWLARTRADPPTPEEMQRSAERAAQMRARVAAIEEREAQRRLREASLGAAATPAGGPDSKAFVGQLSSRGYGGSKQPPQPPPSSSQGAAAGGAAGGSEGGAGGGRGGGG